MRIGVFCQGSASLSRLADVARQSFADLGHDASVKAQSLDGMSSCDFLVFMTEPGNLFGGIPPHIAAVLSKAEGLMGKRCLAIVRKSGFRPGHSLRTLMNILEHEGLVVVDSEMASNAGDIARIIRETPLTRR